MRNDKAFFSRAPVDWLRENQRASILQHLTLFKGGGGPSQPPPPIPPPSINVAREAATGVVKRRKSRGYGSTVLTQMLETLG